MKINFFPDKLKWKNKKYCFKETVRFHSINFTYINRCYPHICSQYLCYFIMCWIINYFLNTILTADYCYTYKYNFFKVIMSDTMLHNILRKLNN